MNKKLIQIAEISLSIKTNPSEIKNKIISILNINSEEIINYQIIKRAIDSRNKKRINFVYTINIEIKNIQNVIKNLETLDPYLVRKHRIKILEPSIYQIKKTSTKITHRPIIVGSGPSGLFTALLLAQAGFKPLIIERGKDLDNRIKDVTLFSKTGELNLESNVQFGEGGAGTFSDGKLYTLITNHRLKYIFEEFIKAGAPKEITWDAKPHIGTDKLKIVVKNIRQKIIKLGGEILFNTKLTDLKIKNNKIYSIIVNDKKEISTEYLILGIGHSARDTYQMLFDKNIKMEAKTFSMGLRIEHSTKMINQSQYGKFYESPLLPAASYKLVAHLPQNRSVYTFCMCPGGQVMNASSEKERLVTNGMSRYAQDQENSNSALLVNVTPEDFGSSHPLAGIEFQRHWENQAFVAGGGDYKAPVQLVGDFLRERTSVVVKKIKPSFKPGVTPTNLDNCLPDYIINSIRKALPILNTKINGFSDPEAILTGVETRSSSPLRILRDENFQTNIKGIYPIGEGSGHAGGIVSSALDGILTAENIIENY